MLPTPRRLAAAIVLTLAASSALAEDWSRFRGPNGSGVSNSTGLPVEFGPETNVAWSTDIPFARSSPVLTGDKIFLTAIDGERFTTMALDRASGQILWQREIERARTDTFHQATDSATPSPVTDGKNVYAFFQETGLVAYSGDGEQRWEMGLGPFRNFYGIAASPVLAGNTLVLVCDQSQGSFILAVDKESGRELWRKDRSARTLSYTTPILYPDSRNPRDVIVLGDKWVDAYDLGTGNSTWSLAGVGAGPVSSPVLDGDLLFVNAPDQAPEPPPPFSEISAEHDSNGDGVLLLSEVEGTWMAKHFGYIDWNGDGAFTAEDWETVNQEAATPGWGIYGIRVPRDSGDPAIEWKNQQSVPYIPTGLIYDGVLYMVKDGIVSAIDPTSGELIKRGRLTKGSPEVYASPVAADGKIYIATLAGQVGVVQAGPDWQVLSLNDLGDEIHASPAISDGHLYVRTRSKLYSFATAAAIQQASR
jgi:outer membrane protein assembly factor BamB